jgi:hypothetical protein
MINLLILGLGMVLTVGCAAPRTTAVSSTAMANTNTSPATSLLDTTKTKTGAGAGTGTTAASVPAGYGIKITQNGKTLLVLSLADIDKLTSVTVSANGSNYTGPTILSILSLAGVTSYSKVTIVGFTKQRLATAELPVAKADLNANYIVRRTNQNTYSLASPDVPFDNWVIDVNELRVEWWP